MSRTMEISTPLGADLLFHGLTAREEMSRLFEYQVDLLGNPEKDVSVNDILGKNVTIKLQLPDDSTRFFNGYVTRFSQRGMYGRYKRYLATVRPWLWFLTRTADCRIFQDMKAPDIVRQVLSEHPASDVKLDLTGSYRKWTYCVQYRETDFNFVSRLMEHEGIGYYFKHTDGHDTMVLTDSTSKHSAVANYAKLSFIAPDEQVRPELEHVSSWSFSCEIQPGAFVHDDYDLERPSVELKTKKTHPWTNTQGGAEVYDYPGTYIQIPDGEQYASVRIEELATQFVAAHGETNARGLTVGALVKLEDHPRPDQNVEHLIVGATYDLTFGDYEALPVEGGTSYQCSFTAIPSSQQYRPKRITPKPFVQGPQTAVVVGPGGEEIYTDKYGRIKVQFHWDRLGKKDENSSCWMRVSYPWAGKGWGGIAIPRLGQEVIVDFLEGDPDQPIVTGRVYNAEQMPPYDLPANKTQSGVKSRSSKGGSAANCNELRFEDLKGSEMVTLHAEKDQTIEVEHDESHSVGHDRSKTIDNDETTHVKHDRTETVDNNETISVHGQRTETVDKDETITIHQNRTETVDKNETITVSGNRTRSVSGNETVTVTKMRTHTVGINEAITVGAAQEVTVGAAQMVTVGAIQAITVGLSQSTNVAVSQSTDVGSGRSISVGADQSTTVGGNLSMSVTGDETRSITGNRVSTVSKDDATKVSKKYVLDVGESIVLKTGESSIEMNKNGTIQIKGKDITVIGGGKINVKADSDVCMKGSKITHN